MENRKVGLLLLGISAVVLLIIFMFNSALAKIIDSTCTMAGHTSCTMTDTLNQQTYLTLGIAGILVLVSLFLIFSKPQEKILIRKVKESSKQVKVNLSDLNSEEKRVLSLIQENKAVFQADIIDKLQLGKAKVSRILDRLENKGIIERKRRGMNNIVVIKQ